ncbi:MAG: oxidoreductase [Paenibacillus sp.]|nr:oxidoreductase [Paenibacillus sp.]
MSKVRTAVVGLNMGLAHAHAYHLSERSDLRWVVDLDEEKAAKVAKELNCQHTADWRVALADVDAISFATPHHLHAPMALEAIAAGKHVLIEKPLANTEEDCLKLIQASEDKGVTLMLAYIVRFRPAVQMLKKLLDEQAYGKTINANCWIEGYLSPRPDTWFAKKDMLGGGVLFSHGCHYIDILIWLLGNPVQVAGLGTRVGTDWLEGEGTHHSVLQFESGALGHLVCSWGLQYKSTPALLHVHTTEACFVLAGSKLDVITKDGRQTLYEPTAPAIPNSSALGEVDHFLECIQTGKRPLTDGYEGLKSHRVVWALYSHQGTPVTL